ncbi:pyridoxamine 5'-phosphate oxidase [Elstera cyanobacteriorum]|uniref:pyridoxamine 5'-phosphate oxidase n=1 Tax=Elstera cyanobacteriorum TaxID=2022747 RepID=UPI0023562BC1|nr:pyridoxamine 5'-phosphate oxidase [Elstera cyanobacteriorum]MCK6444635.1 pyridoxamine 5'-phosphate oxidase [Elstera cyanobacteriorum]
MLIDRPISAVALTAQTDPFLQFAQWFDAAAGREVNDPNAMSLATVGADGRPSVRIVLLKGFDADGFVFYTNTQSRKGGELLANPFCALTFHWKTLERQVRIEGKAALVSDAEADSYYHSRPHGSQIGAWASEQSRPLPDRATLEARVAEMEQRYPEGAVPRPPHWTGFRVVPDRVEFWQGMPYRLHDRMVYERDGAGWTTHRLYP